MSTIEQTKQAIENVESQINDLSNKIGALQHDIYHFEYECSESDFDDYLDSIYPEINIGSLTFYPSQVMKDCDPIAYRCAKSDYESEYDLDDCEEYCNLKDELEELESELVDLESELEELQDELDELESELD